MARLSPGAQLEFPPLLNVTADICWRQRSTNVVKPVGVAADDARELDAHAVGPRDAMVLEEVLPCPLPPLSLGCIPKLVPVIFK